jgi:hypothetical protein
MNKVIFSIEDKQTHITINEDISRAIIVGDDDDMVGMNVFFRGGNVRTCMTHEETKALIAALQLAMTA